MKSAVLGACRLMLEPVARLMLKAGIGFKEFAELGKQVFVDVARRDYGLQGRPTNAARVALMTGLARREVARVRDTLDEEITEAPRSSSRLSEVLSGWHLDPDFTDANGAPLRLPLDGGQASLNALLDRYGGDIPHGALIKELTQLGLVSADGDSYQVEARDYIRELSDPDMLRQGGRAMHDHAETILHNVAADRAGAPRFERMATQVALAEADARAFEEFLAERGQAFLEEMDSWLSARKSRVQDRARGKYRVGVGMYLIHDDQTGNE